jgi:RNase P subunit RPR2
MRVIRPSEVEVKCPHCRALLGVTSEDIVINDTGHGSYVSCTCPECRKKIDLDRVSIPHSWMQE